MKNDAELQINVLCEDDDICVIDKESGHVVHKTRGSGDSPVILQTLRDQLGKRIYPVHRLDRGTSGLMAFAFSSESAAGLQVSLGEGRKMYQALCLGHLDPEGEFNRELTGENKVKKEALTKYKVLKEYADYSLLELEIFHGRKHQIRRHLSFEGHHIIGDVNHGKGWLNRRFREGYNFHRLFLHCHYLSFWHPVDRQKKVEYTSKLPAELESLLTHLK